MESNSIKQSLGAFICCERELHLCRNTGGGVFVSSNNGVSWDNTAIAGGRVYALLNEGGKIIAGTFESGIFVTSNNGVSWTAKNEGFGSVISVYSLLIKDNMLYAGTSLSVWKRPVSEIIKVRSISSEIPQKFALNQNYPNPFNSTTRIEFKVSKNEFINIKVFDINGKVIETLVNEKLNPGTYSVNFKGYNISSGIYFYKMTANNFLETKKFILIK